MLISHQDSTTFTHVLKKLQCELAEPLAEVCKTASLSASVLEDSGSCLCNSQVQEARWSGPGNYMLVSPTSFIGRVNTLERIRKQRIEFNRLNGGISGNSEIRGWCYSASLSMFKIN